MSIDRTNQFESIVHFIRDTFNSNEFIPLHEPRFIGKEKQYLDECIDSTFVSTVGQFVDRFEENIANYTGAKFAIATSNGTAALHISLLLSDVNSGDEVITQPLTFVASSNAIRYCNASPIFVDVDLDTMGLSPTALDKFLNENCKIVNYHCVNNITGKTIKACVPVHTFGHPCKIDEISSICKKWHINLVEDAAESLGSFYKSKHTGNFGKMGVISFNGNKIITGGGGGCIITDDEVLAKRAKHLTTTAKVPHKWKYTHDMIGYNYRMPNLNAALLVAQLENLESFLINKRKLATMYKDFFSDKEFLFVEEPLNSISNYWLNVIILKNKEQRDLFLDETNSKGVMSRPIWTLMNKLTMFENSQCGDLANVEWLEERAVNIPSSVTIS
jgi:perosamine synthetase